MRATAVLEGELVALAGRLDGPGAPVARDALHTALAAGRGVLVVDLSGVELLDAVGVGVLLGTQRRAARLGRRLVLQGARPRVERILALTRVDRIVTVQPGSAPAA